MTAEGHHAILHVQGDGVEHVAISDAVICQLLSEFGFQFLVRDVGAGHFDVVADGGDALHFVNAFVGIHFVLIEIHCPGQDGDAVVHTHLDVFELRFVQL